MQEPHHVQALDDIEDLVATDGWDDFHRPHRADVVIPRVRRRAVSGKKQTAGSNAGDSSPPQGPPRQTQFHPRQHSRHLHDAEENDGPSGPIPGTEKIWVKTFGCAHNISDSEYMEGMLSTYGYTLLGDEEKDQADLWVINSCTVKDPSQAAFVNLVRKAQAVHRPVVVAGCVPQGERKLTEIAGLSVVGVQQIDRVVEVVEKTLEGNTVRLLGKGDLPRLNLPKIRRNPLVEIIPLSTGCLGACTYCKTRHARGKLGSYAPEAILDRAREVLKEGVTEIWLSSEDTGAFGRDLGSSISKLMDGLVALLPEDVMLRLGMTNPPFLLEQMDEISEVLCHPNVFSFLHVPVQSGSDRVLSAMRREYTVGEFIRLADFLLDRVPGLCLATDIICGFPGETEEDFEETLRLVRRYRPAILNISQFYPRPGTPAAKMRRVPTSVVKDRSRRLTRLFESFDPYRGMEGQIFKVWVNSEMSDDGRHVVGHTKSYVKVLLPYDAALFGGVAQARVLSVARFHVVAEVLGFEKIRRDLVGGGSGGQVLLNLSHRRARRRHLQQHLLDVGGCGDGLRPMSALARAHDHDQDVDSEGSHLHPSRPQHAPTLPPALLPFPSTTSSSQDAKSVDSGSSSSSFRSQRPPRVSTSGSASYNDLLTAGALSAAPPLLSSSLPCSAASPRHPSEPLGVSVSRASSSSCAGVSTCGGAKAGHKSNRSPSPGNHHSNGRISPCHAILAKPCEVSSIGQAGAGAGAAPVLSSCATCVLNKNKPCNCSACVAASLTSDGGSGSLTNGSGSHSLWGTGSFRWDRSWTTTSSKRHSTLGRFQEIAARELRTVSFWVLVGLLCCIVSWLMRCAGEVLA